MSQPRTRSIIAAIDDLCLRNQDNRAFMKKVFYVGAGLMTYGFIWLLWYGYQYAIADSHQYAQLAIMTVSGVALASGAWWCTVYRRWTFSEESAARLHALKLTIKGGIPMVVVVLAMSLGVFSQAIVWDNYMVVKVRATDEVKEELKWLLGDRYPYEDEVNIDPVTLEWKFETVGSVNSEQSRLLRAYSPNVSEFDRGFFRGRELDIQRFEVIWRMDAIDYQELIELDWDSAEIYSYQITEDKKGYPICNLRVPIKTILSETIEYRVLLNGVNPEKGADSNSRLIDHDASFTRAPKALPDMFQIDNQHLIVRTNFAGSSWATYCHYNFPQENGFHIPEPITELSLNGLNVAPLKIHFHLFKELRSNIKDAEEVYYRRLGSYDEFIEELNEFVAFEILDTGISSIGSSPKY